MKCPNEHCLKENDSNHCFCAFCGTPLSKDLRTLVDEAVVSRLKGQNQRDETRAVIDEVLISRLKDREVVEVTTAHAIAERVWSWAKLFGAIVGVSLAVLLAAAILLGYQSVKDV